jgi:hypothetical protein
MPSLAADIALSALPPSKKRSGAYSVCGSTDALQRELIQPARLFEEKLEELTHFIRNDFPDSHKLPLQRIGWQLKSAGRFADTKRHTAGSKGGQNPETMKR